MATRIQRLLALLQWVASHADGVEVSEACERFAMTETELVRELEMATMIGDGSAEFDDMPFLVIIEGSRVEASLLSFRRPLRITEPEGLVLLASARALIDDETDPDGPLARALAKLADHLGVAIGTSMDVDLDHDGGETGRTLAAAVEARRRVRFTYWSYGRDSVEQRLVEPWQLLNHDGEWYLSGLDVDKEGARRFRLDRIDGLEVTDDPATSPVPKDHSIALGEDAPHVVLDLGPSASWVVEAYPVQSFEPVGERLRVKLAVTGASWLERILLRLGSDAEVVEIDPRVGELDIVARAAERVLARYR